LSYLEVVTIIRSRYHHSGRCETIALFSASASPIHSPYVNITTLTLLIYGCFMVKMTTSIRCFLSLQVTKNLSLVILQVVVLCFGHARQSHHHFQHNYYYPTFGGRYTLSSFTKIRTRSFLISLVTFAV
jgi:hypothetical protein